MDTKSKEVLAGILEKEPASLTSDEVGVLQARRSYLNSEQKKVFAEALKVEVDDGKGGKTKVEVEDKPGDPVKLEKAAITVEAKSEAAEEELKVALETDLPEEAKAKKGAETKRQKLQDRVTSLREDATHARTLADEASDAAARRIGGQA